jgi:hypothetical protein
MVLISSILSYTVVFIFVNILKAVLADLVHFDRIRIRPLKKTGSGFRYVSDLRLSKYPRL